MNKLVRNENGHYEYYIKADKKLVCFVSHSPNKVMELKEKYVQDVR